MSIHLLRFACAILAVAHAQTARPCPQNLSALNGISRAWRRAWSERGFLGPKPELSVANLKEAFALGMMWWDLPIYFLADIESAKSHNAALDPLARGIYILGFEVKRYQDFFNFPLGQDFRPVMLQEWHAAVFRTATKNGAFAFRADGKVRHLSPKTLLKRISGGKISAAIGGPYYGDHAYLSIQGWVAPWQRGILTYDAEFVRRRSVRRAQNLRAKLLAAGYKIDFAAEFGSALAKLAAFHRGGLPSRYLNPIYKKTALDLFAEGKAYLLEIKNPRGETLAGALGYLVAHTATGETVYVNESARDAFTQKVDPIDLYRVLAVTLVEHFAQQGILQLDVQMLTNFSKSLGGKMVPREEFLRGLGETTERPGNGRD